MEILMKLKCSPSAPPTHSNSAATLKVVDHHHQLQQQHATSPHLQSPLTAAAPPPPLHSHARLPTHSPSMNYNPSSVAMPPMPLRSMPRIPTTATATTPRSCVNYASKSLDCCNAGANHTEVAAYDLQWREQQQQQQGRRGLPFETTMQQIPPPSCCAPMTSGSMYDTPSCCSRACQVPGCGGGPPPLQAAAPPPTSLRHAPPLQPPPLAYPSLSAMTSMTAAEGAFDGSVIGQDFNTHYAYEEPEENFVSIEDTKIKNLLMKLGRQYELERQEREMKEKEKAAAESALRQENEKFKDQQVFYEIIELDDEDDNQDLRRQVPHPTEISTQKSGKENILQHGDLFIKAAPAAGLEKPKQARMKSPSISLIPKSPEPPEKTERSHEQEGPEKTSRPHQERACEQGRPALSTSAQKQPRQRQQQKINPAKERIIAHIDLSDSSDSEAEERQNTTATNVDDKRANEAPTVNFQSNANNQADADDDDDSDEMSFAAAAVSCELQCEDDDNTVLVGGNDGAVVFLNSDDENDERVKMGEYQWNVLERREKGRQFFECYLCGKTVQSSYNLRRHMMIHTGERPFSCDLCDRRFREFSDLKKHRRRHANEPNFVCMVCRLKKPTAHDPTRCSDCDSNKTSAMALAMRAQQQQHNTAPSSPAASATSPNQSQASSATPAVTPTPTPTPQRAAELQPQQAPVKSPQVTESAVKAVDGITTTATITMIPTVTESKGHSPSRASPSKTQQINEIPLLVPINTPITTNTSKTTTTAADAQHLLDKIPAVHRSNYNVYGLGTRKEFPCPLCQRAFGTRHNLKRHFMIHTGEKPHSCSKCRKPFREYSTLKKHMVTHQRERYYKCMHCPRKYRDYLDYSEHKKQHANEPGIHNADADEDEDEDEDDAASSSMQSSPRKRAKTQYDSQSEDDEEGDSSGDCCWLECCECKQRYTDIDSYTKHLKEHDPNVYLYECYICKKTFEQRDELVEHVSACKVELRETALKSAVCFN